MKLTTMEESNARKKRQTKQDRIRKQNDWRRENADVIQIKVSKKYHIRDFLETTCGDRGKQAYIISAILEKLERDGIDIHMFDE